MFWNKKKPIKPEVNPVSILAELLSKSRNQEDFLGVSKTYMPTPEQLLSDSAKYLQYTQSDDYMVFAKEAWSRVIVELETVFNPNATTDQVHNARGAVRAILDLLGLSYKVRSNKERMEKEQPQNVSLAR
jgi:hypothetical protein